MKKVLLALFLVSTVTTFAQTKRALFIGINTYFPEGAKTSGDREAPPNLDGCVNDALAIKEIMQTRYGFDEKNISTLFNQDASRAAIIAAIENLIATSNKGDVVFIFYAGHGSQVNNSLSKENDKKDETIVPADAFKGEFDIRDKELAALLNKLLDKGVILTAIFDSCHSGSLSRGGVEPAKYRFSPSDNRDVKDPSEPTPPEDRGALIISAARDIEPAKEVRDEQGLPHGGFTMALTQVLRDEPIGSNVQQLFNRIEAIMQYYNLTQKPVLAANEVRRTGTFLGIDKSQLPDKLIIPLIKIENGLVVLQAGMPSRLSPKSELQRKTDKGIIKLEVVRLDGPNRCYAKITAGDPKGLKPGDAFEVTNVVMEASAAIKIYIYNSTFDLKTLTATVSNLQSQKFNWNKENTNAYQNIYFDKNAWVMTYGDKKPETIGADINADKLKGKITTDSTVSFKLPATQSIAKVLQDRFKKFSVVTVVSNPLDADYHLLGRYRNGKIEYALVNPDRMTADPSASFSMPARTNYFEVSDKIGAEQELADSLEEYILRIAKVKSWLTLQAPPDDGSFPFSFALRNSSTGKLIGDGGEVKFGDTLGLVFTLDEVNEAYWDRNKRYIYVFSIDDNAKMTLLFPRTITGENTYPVVDRQTFEIKQNAPLGAARLFKCSDSVGIDNYIMFTSAEPINNLEIFKQEGVKDEIRDLPGSQLESLLKGVGSSTRDGELIAPTNWSITRISVKCVPRK
jgi:hypothetical protein